MSALLPPRLSLGLPKATTAIGEARDAYSREVEGRPSRFTDPQRYSEWAARADAWAASRIAEQVPA